MSKLPLVLFLWRGFLLWWTACGPDASSCASSDENAPTVETDLGIIIGCKVEVNGTHVHRFLGVPYAKPPTDELRFKKTEPLTVPWSEPLLATCQPAACPQFNENSPPWYDDKPGKSEDCLYLNIWTPADACKCSKNKAVMFWIYGGGYTYGSNRLEIYSAEALSALGDIIVVTVNYRVGSFGFFYSGSDDAPGNAGIWDVLTGLQWVNDHISAFGGDTSRITVAGASAGSITAGLLAVTPLSRNLYTRLIMQSASPAYLLAEYNTDSIVLSNNIAEIVNCSNSTFTLQDNPTDVVNCLLGVDALAISEAEYRSIFPSPFSFLARYGDELFPDNPREAIRAGNFTSSDIIILNCADEGSFFLTTIYRDIFGFFGEKNTVINRSTGEDMIREMFSAVPNSESVVRYFLPENISTEDNGTVRYQVYTAIGDYVFLCPEVYTAEMFAACGNKVHYYVWSHIPSTTPWAEWMGVATYTDVEFVFGLPVMNPENYEEEEIGLSKDFIRIWSNFAKYGEPMEPHPLYSRENPQFTYLGGPKANTCGIGPQKENCDFFRPFFGFE